MSGTDPFRWWQYDGWCTPMRLDQLPEYHAPCWEAHYENDCERGKRTTRQLLDPWSRVMTVMESDASVAAWIEHLGYQVEMDPTHHGGGLHVTEPGGWLNVHLDYDRHPIVPRTRRALNLIAFLNPEWKQSYGGALILCASSGTPFKRVYPAPGRLFAFEVSDVSYHGVEQVLGPIPRVTCACYLLAKATGKETRTRALFMPTRDPKKTTTGSPEGSTGSPGGSN